MAAERRPFPRLFALNRRGANRATGKQILRFRSDYRNYVLNGLVKCVLATIQTRPLFWTVGVRWFTADELTPLNLSANRVTVSQLETIYKLASDPPSTALCD
jgi:hypothetical protein